MSQVVLCFFSDEDAIAFIETNLDVKLQKIRERIHEELSDLIPGNFTFIFRNVAITRKQESKLEVRQCAERDCTKPGLAYNLRIQLLKGEDFGGKESPACSDSKPRVEESVGCTINVDEVTGNIHPGKSSRVDFFPESEIYGQTCWLEKERMLFWNAKGQQLIQSKETLHYKKLELAGIIESSWAFRKVELLNNRISGLKMRLDRYKTVFEEKYMRACQTKTSSNLLDISQQLLKHQDNVSEILCAIKEENKKILILKATNTSESYKVLNDLEKNIHGHLHQLKRSSDSLFKALCAQESRLDTFEEEHIKNDDSLEVSNLEAWEVTELASQILNTDQEQSSL